MLKDPCPSCGTNLAWTSTVAEFKRVAWYKFSRMRLKCPKCAANLRRVGDTPIKITAVVLIVGSFFGLFRPIRELWGPVGGWIAGAVIMIVMIYLMTRQHYVLDESEHDR